MKDKRVLFDYGKKLLAKELNLCLWPGDGCKNKAIRAHSVQNNSVLETLSRDGHVIMPILETYFKNPPRLIFKEIGRKKATTFTGLCAYHDNFMFEPIENNPINLANLHHLFLLAYRAVLKEAYITRKVATRIQQTYLKGVEKGFFSKDEPSDFGMFAVEKMISAYLVEEVKRQFDEAFLNNNWNKVRHEVIVLEAGPGIAVNSMFSTDIYSEKTDAAAFITLNVFPKNLKTVVVFSYLEDNRPEAHQAFGHLWISSGLFLQYQLSKLIIKKCENVVIAPALFDTFSDKKKKAIAQFFQINNCGRSFDTEDSDLFIFAPPV